MFKTIFLQPICAMANLHYAFLNFGSHRTVMIQENIEWRKKMLHFHWITVRRKELPGKLTWPSWTCTWTIPPPPRCPRSWSFSSRSRSWTIVNCWLAFEVLGKSPVDFAVLAANRLDRVWAVVGTREGTETEIERTFLQAAGNDPLPTHCQESAQELLAKNNKREPYSLSPNGC